MSDTTKTLDEILRKLRSGRNAEIEKDIAEAITDLEALIVEARDDELLKACTQWEKDPNHPATYLIDRRAALKNTRGEKSE